MYIKPKNKILIINLSLFLVVMLILFSAFEITLRVIQGSERIENSQGELIFEGHPELGHKMKPNFEARFRKLDFNTEFSTNSQGFRDDEFSIQDEKIIFMLGDSFTAGQGVEENQTHSSLLEENLNQYKVYNLGVFGYSQRQQVIQLKQYLPIYNPEIVIINLYIGNDLIDNCGELPTIKKETTTYEKIKNFIKKSQAITFIYKKAVTPLTKTKNFYFHIDSPDIQECYNITKEHLKEIKNLSEQHDAELLITLIARQAQTVKEKEKVLIDWYDNFEEFSLESFDLYIVNKRMLEICKDLEIDCLDLTQSFKKQDGKINLYVADGHWNSKGHELAANELSEYLINSLFLKQI